MPAGRRRGGAPEEVEFQTKPEIALGMMKRAINEGVPVGVVLPRAGYGAGTRFRGSLEELGLRYVAGCGQA